MNADAVKLVEDFWGRMATNEFRSVGSILADAFVLCWLRSQERIRGRDNFVTMNEEYPAQGRWQFTINSIVGNDSEAVSDVSVTDGVQKARVISFFTVREGKIFKMVEFWPAPFPAPDNRRHLVEKVES
jgi:SnoaL-like domain